MSCVHCGATLDVGALVCVECRREQGRSAAVQVAPPPEAPAAFAEACPKHPDRPVAGACPRCGAFVCIRCAPGAANEVLTCVECLAREQQQHALQPSPFGGPLVLPLLGLLFQALVFIGVLSAAALVRAPLGTAQQVMLALSAVSVALTAPAMVGFLRRSRWLPAMMVGLYALDAAIAGLGWRSSSIAWIAWSAGWSAYFLLARRVKTTFTR